jgi:hypothetical protein
VVNERESTTPCCAVTQRFMILVTLNNNLKTENIIARGQCPTHSQVGPRLNREQGMGEATSSANSLNVLMKDRLEASPLIKSW